MKEINKVQDVMPRNHILPGKTAGHELQTAYKLLAAHGIFKDEMIIIKAKIPLYLNQESAIFKIIPIPFIGNSQKMIPAVAANYMIYNTALNTFHLMSDADLNKCRWENEETRVCQGNWAWKDAEENFCETTPMRPHSKMLCSMDEYKEQSFWIKLGAHNRWLFKTFENTSGQIQCSDSHHQLVRLPKVGILDLTEGCSLRLKGVTLQAPQSIHTSFKVNFSTHFIKEADDEAPFELTPIGTLTINNTKELQKLHEKIQYLNDHKVHLVTNQWYVPVLKRDVPNGCAAYGFVVEGTLMFVFSGMIEYGKYPNELYELQAIKLGLRKMYPETPDNGVTPCPPLGHSFTMVGEKIFLSGGLGNESDDPKK
ncbi:GH19657 [Drosophila grimshawi]|uniref:GH19657 n=1 Tax=Drosophila grimshawi TaxID=7222 RepID=B4K118_DROGR|nr:GH19657 [Drosophila grimshawi]